MSETRGNREGWSTSLHRVVTRAVEGHRNCFTDATKIEKMASVTVIKVQLYTCTRWCYNMEAKLVSQMYERFFCHHGQSEESSVPVELHIGHVSRTCSRVFQRK